MRVGIIAARSGCCRRTRCARPNVDAPGGEISDLVYTSDFVGNVYVYTLPALTFVGELAGLGANTVNLCSDTKGHVFVPVQNGTVGEVLEFEHGGTTPIATISDASARTSTA